MPIAEAIKIKQKPRGKALTLNIPFISVKAIAEYITCISFNTFRRKTFRLKTKPILPIVKKK